jgi:serine/threonine protein phosphatase PrpC
MNNYDPNLVGAVTDKGLYRAQNEDALWQPDHVSPVHLGALYIVADGVGGQEHGGIAARMAVAVLSDAFYRAREAGEDIPKALKRAILQANQAVYDEAQLSGLRMGATVVTAVHHHGQLYVGHVGDSRAYLVTSQKVKPLTRDDSIVQQQLDAGLITPAEAAKHQFSNLVTQVLGNKLEIDVHMGEPQAFCEGDSLLLCSDGLSGVVSPEAIHTIVAENPASVAAGMLIQAAKDAESQDNITAVVVNQSAQQMPFVPVPDVDEKPKRERSMWLWGGMVLFFIVVTVLLWWWRGQQTDDRATLDVSTPEAVVQPVVETPSSTSDLLLAVDEAETAVPEATSTPFPTETSQAAVIDTVSSTETATPEPTATPTSLGCVDPAIFTVYVWLKEDLTAETCASASAQLSFAPGEEFIILQTTPETFPSPGNCQDVAFLEVQSLADEAVTGWVLETQILRDEACP